MKNPHNQIFPISSSLDTSYTSRRRTSSSASSKSSRKPSESFSAYDNIGHSKSGYFVEQLKLGTSRLSFRRRDSQRSNGSTSSRCWFCCFTSHVEDDEMPVFSKPHLSTSSDELYPVSEDESTLVPVIERIVSRRNSMSYPPMNEVYVEHTSTTQQPPLSAPTLNSNSYSNLSSYTSKNTKELFMMVDEPRYPSLETSEEDYIPKKQHDIAAVTHDENGPTFMPSSTTLTTVNVSHTHFLCNCFFSPNPLRSLMLNQQPVELQHQNTPNHLHQTKTRRRRRGIFSHKNSKKKMGVVQSVHDNASDRSPITPRSSDDNHHNSSNSSNSNSSSNTTNNNKRRTTVIGQVSNAQSEGNGSMSSTSTAQQQQQVLSSNGASSSSSSVDNDAASIEKKRQQQQQQLLLQQSEQHTRTRSSTLPSISSWFRKRKNNNNNKKNKNNASGGGGGGSSVVNNTNSSNDESDKQVERSSLDLGHHQNISSDKNGAVSKSFFRETKLVRMGTDEEGNKTVNEYSIIRTLGSGSYGKVKLAMDSNNKAFAIKIMNKSMLKRVQKSDDVRKEVAILKKMKHPNVVRLYEVIDDPENEKLFLVMEYVQNGPVLKLENNRAKCTFSEQKSRKYINDILSGLEYLHSMRVCHRDIKPENLLLDGSDNVKLSDFGVSTMYEGEDDTVKVTAGTPAFLAPEACTGEKYSGRMADIWAVGVTLFIFTFGYLPFNGDSYMEMYKSIQNDPLMFPDADESTEVSAELKNLIKRMLEKDAKNRIRLPDIKNHPWITQTGTIEEAEKMESVYDMDLDDESETIPITDTEVKNAIVEGSSKVVDQFFMLVKMKSKLKKMADDARTKVPDPDLGSEVEAITDDSSEKQENQTNDLSTDMDAKGVTTPE